MSRASLVVGFLLPVVATPAAAEVRFSTEQQTVIYTNRIASGAARQLSGQLEKCWGRNFPVQIVEDLSQIDPEQQAVWMGLLTEEFDDLDAGKLGDQGFWLKSHAPNHLIIYANTGRAYRYAVTYLLEKYLGFGWFWAGDLGTVIPERSPRVVDSVDEQRVPAFKARRFSGCTSIHVRLHAGRMREREWVLFDDVELAPISSQNKSD